MHRSGRLLVIAVLLVAALPFGAARAAPPAQSGELIPFAEPLPATLQAGMMQNTHAFPCTADAVYSIVVIPQSADFEPTLTVFDTNRSALAEGLALEGGGVAAEAFTPTGSGSCTANISGGNGDYTIQLLGGYADVQVYDMFSADSPAGLEWPPYDGDAVDVGVEQKQLWVEVSAGNMVGYALSEEQIGWTNFYAQMDVTVEGSPSYFEYGFIFYSDGGADEFYSATFSSDGDYSVFYFGGGEWTTVHEWTVSPLVDGADQNPQIAAWVQSGALRLYFNGALVDEIDLGDYLDSGEIGVAAGTIPDQADTLLVRYDNLIITAPAALTAAAQAQQAEQAAAEAAAEAATGGYPTLLNAWQSGGAQPVIDELAAAGVIPDGGMVAMNVPSSYGDTSNPGFNFYPLGRGAQFEDLVLSFAASVPTGTDDSACGMHFRRSSSTTRSTSALLFPDGRYYLGYFDDSGSAFDGNLFGEVDVINTGIGTANRVIVVAVGENVAMYVNGQLVALGQFPAAPGTVALELLVPTDDNNAGLRTHCQLENIWLWGF